jgi:hypothetical protein
MVDDQELLKNCKNILNNAKDCKEEIGLSDDEAETYLKMAETLKPEEVSKVLELALKIQSSKTIKDTELRNEASRIIRAINMS